MQIDVQNRPAASSARVQLARGETLTTEVGALIAMSPQIRVETSSRTRGGGMLAGLRRIFAGENFFLNHFTADADAQELIVGPALMGDIMHYRLATGSLVVQGSSWLASSSGIDIDASWQGFTSALFSGERAFWVKLSGVGDVLLASFGGIYEVDVADGYVVDTGHIVAFEDTLGFSIGKAGASLVGSFLGGEGLVCKFSGQGKLYCQTHNPPNFGKLLGPRLHPR